MRKTIYAIAMLAVSLLAISCQEGSGYLQQESLTTVIKAKAEKVGDAMTRTQMAYGYDVLWNEGDEICVLGFRGNNNYFNLVSGAGTPYGTFECNEVSTAVGHEIEALFPASIASGSTLIWPAAQDRNSVMPMYCHQTLTKDYLRFKSLGGILQIVFVKNMQVYPIIKYVKVEDGSKTLSGTFKVDNEGKAVITATDKAGITLETGMDKALGWGAGIINIALPAETYTSLKLTFTDQDGRELVRNVSESVTISRNGITKVIVLGDRFKDASPSTGYAKATINGRDVDVPWVRLWWKGPKFAAYNIGATKLEEYGGYYNWGSEVNRLDDDEYDKYKDGSNRLSGDDDTATALWGQNWRMPTKEEFQKLREYCDRSWVRISNTGAWGMQFRGRTDEYAGNFLFFPAAGYVMDSQMHLTGDDYSPRRVNTEGQYWSSDVSDNGNTLQATYCLFTDNEETLSSVIRDRGVSVRAVLVE